MNQQKKQLLSAYFPELTGQFQAEENNNAMKGVKDAVTTENLVGIILNMIARRLEDIKDGKDGQDYILTDADKQEIADSITVPIVDKIIEKTIVKQPIVNEVTNNVENRETPEELANKINTLSNAIDWSVIKTDNIVDKKQLDSQLKLVQDGMAKIDGRVKLIDQRWHGGGLSQVSHDGTLTGTGTASSPLSIVGTGTSVWYQDEIVATGVTGTSFNLLHTPLNVVFLYLNGQHLTSGVTYDYTRAGAALTLATSLLSTDVLTATYS